MPRNLTITPAPYKSSRLAIPPTPFSPRLPITPVKQGSPPLASRKSSLPQAQTPAQTKAAILSLSPPPSEPLNWLWQCHICTRVYQLGVTRRCLDDGHFFCAGTTTVKRSRKTNKRTVKHKACASEFDYQGWKNWGVWRRGVEERIEAARSMVELAEGYGVGEPVEGVEMENEKKEYFEATEGEWFSGGWKKQGFWRPKKNCWGSCDYPSECRWGKQYGVSTPPPSTPAKVKENHVTSGNKAKKASLVTFDDFLDESSMASPEPVAEIVTGDVEVGDGHLVEDSDGLWTTNGDKSLDRKPSLDDLLESVKRRKRKSAGALPSPLGSNPPSPTAQQSHDSDIEMTDADLATTIGSGATASVLQKAFDDFELDVKKSFERAGGLVAGWASSLRGSASSSSLPGVSSTSTEDEDSKVEALTVVKALRVGGGRKKGFSLGGSDVLDL